MMYRKTLHVFALSTLIMILAVLGSGVRHASAQDDTPAAPSAASGTVVADLGFRPDANGFGFPNYGADVPATNLTPVEMRRLFGDSVCASINGDTCTLVPQAQELMTTLNGEMAGGHCEGMAILSTLFFTGMENPANFGQPQTIGLPFDNDAKLQREIAMWFSTQFLKSVNAASITDKSPKDILAILTNALKTKSDYYVVGIFQPGFKDGHAITPYEVQDMGNGLFHVMVYDNNWPNDDNRYIEIDTNANTWSYMAATNPDEPEALYKGDATTLTLQLSPITMLVTPQSCPSCQLATPAATSLKPAPHFVSYQLPQGRAFAEQAAPEYNQISLYSSEDVSDADLLITDSQGHRLGYQDNQFYHEIPGAVFIPVASGNLFEDDPEPVYDIPVGTAFTVTVDGTNLQKDEINNVSMVGPSYDLAVENIKLAAGESDTITFSPDGSAIAYTPSSDEAPDILLGLTHSGADYEFQVNGADVEPGATINVSLDYDKGSLGIHTSGTDEKSTTYALQVERITDTADNTFNHNGLTIDTNATAYAEFGAWDGKGDMTVSIDKNSDGTNDETQTAPNQPPQ